MLPSRCDLRADKKLHIRLAIPSGRIARRGDKLSAVQRRKVRGVVIPIDQWSEKFVSEAVGEGEFRICLPSIHGIEGMSRCEIMHDVGRCENYQVRVAEKQIGQRIRKTAGDNSGFQDQALRSFDIEKIVAPSEVLVTELEAVRAFQPVQVLDQVPPL